MILQAQFSAKPLPCGARTFRCLIFYITLLPFLRLLLFSSSSSSLDFVLPFCDYLCCLVLGFMEGRPVGFSFDDDLPNLPPGFRFHPTDEEIISCYLTKKVLNTNFTAVAIGEADFNKCEPWDLPKKARMGEREFYFFCQKDRKYPSGVRTNRATASGYWKATGKDKEIFRGEDCLVGMKKTLVFYKGRAPKGEKMNWVMHEYRLAKGKSSPNIPHPATDEWVVCRIVHKNSGTKKVFVPTPGHGRVNSFGDNHMQELDYASLPPLMDPATCSITQSTGSLPESLEGSYLDCFPEWPSEFPPIKPPVKIGDTIIGSNNHYYAFGFGQQYKQEVVDQQPRSTTSPSQETDEISPVFSPLDADFWE